jgi:transposase
VIPTRKDQKQDEDFDKKTYKRRNLVERLFNRLKQNRRIATRYEKRARCYLAFLILAAIRLWL